MALLMLSLFCLVLNCFVYILNVCLFESVFFSVDGAHHDWCMQTCCSQKVPFRHNRILKSQLIFRLFLNAVKKVDKQLILVFTSRHAREKSRHKGPFTLRESDVGLSV